MKQEQEQRQEQVTQERSFVRLTREQRIQHWVMVVSFTVLAITGLPLRFPEVSWLASVYTVIGGLEMARILHRIAGVFMILDGLYHLGYITVLLVKNKFKVMEAWPMIPTGKDAADFWDTTLYYLGLRTELPQYDRFNFREKFDYFAVFWGLPVMMLSGLILWFPVFFGNMLPNLAIGMAYIAHSDEAILAISAIVVWHFYNVHLNPDVFPMSWVWWHGNISETHIKRDHPLEYTRLVAAQQILNKPDHTQEA
jgi:formate dehydrogenase gamma subunit